MKLHDAVHNFRYSCRAGWCGEFIDSKDYDLAIHQLPGHDRDLSCADAIADDWEEFHMPEVGEGVVI